MVRNIIISLMVILLVSCGTLTVKVKPNASFSKQSSITIVGGDDVTGTKGELEFLLLEKGFNIISESVAKKAVKYNKDIKDSDSLDLSLDAEITSIKEFKSIYALELNYTYIRYALHYAYKSFSAKVIDLNTGEILLTAMFRGDRPVSSVLEDFADKMGELIK